MTSESAILIAGSFGHGNTGDEAILSVVVSRLRKARPSIRLFVVGGALEAIAARDIDPVPWNDWSGIAELVPSVDMVLLAGGGLFFDYGTFDSAAILETRLRPAHFAGFSPGTPVPKPLAILGCGVGPLLSPVGRRMSRFAFSGGARFRSGRGLPRFSSGSGRGPSRSLPTRLPSNPRLPTGSTRSDDGERGRLSSAIAVLAGE
jgi:polysaccharide pyruvyl transferase WcaK-like protein